MQRKSPLCFSARRATAKSNDRRERITEPRSYSSKLTELDVRRIRTMHTAGLGVTEIHRQLTGEGMEISYSTVRSVAHGLTWNRLR